MALSLTHPDTFTPALIFRQPRNERSGSTTAPALAGMVSASGTNSVGEGLRFTGWTRMPELALANIP